MSQVSVNIMCRICNRQLAFPPNAGIWQFLEYQAKFMQDHDKCELLKEQIAEASKKKTPSKAGVKNVNRSAKP